MAAHLRINAREHTFIAAIVPAAKPANAETGRPKMRDWREEHRESRFKWPLKLPSTHVEGVETLAEAQEVMDSKIGSDGWRDEAWKRLASFNKRWQRKVFRQAMRIVDTKLAESEASNFRLRLEPLSENVADKYRQDQADLVHTLQELGVQPKQIERE